MARDHRKLRAFQLSDELVFLKYELTACFPKDETFVLTAQMRRAALSVANNIVEGRALASHGEYLKHLNIAMGSLRELGYDITVAKRRQYATPALIEANETKCEETARVLGALIRSLRNGT
jgi:four helix bundle protein